MDASGTIAAISTPAGEGAIGIIRISGPEAISIAGRIFRTSCGASAPDLPSHRLHHGRVHHPESGEALDEALLAIMRSPRSYTGEDTVEIHCHGGVSVTSAILDVVLAAGARPASPGEFTRRAYLNGRMDLAQAEGVIELIRSRTEAGRRAALMQLEGGLSRELRPMRQKLLELAAGLEAELDFEEETTEAAALLPSLRDLAAGFRRLLSAARRGALCQHGVKVVIAGRPNVGKSSLFNALLEAERAIVTPHPGTTRDTVEGCLSLEGIPLRLVDCAGIREARCEVEQEGVRRSLSEVAEAPLVLMVVDAADGVSPEDEAIFAMLKEKDIILVRNKEDLARQEEGEESSLASRFPGRPLCSVSSLRRTGLDTLKEIILSRARGGDACMEASLSASVRHREALRRASVLLDSAAAGALEGIPLDALAADVRLALDAVGEITGETATEEILDAVFSRFCIGK